MRVKFYATLRPIVGGKAVDIPVAQRITVRALIAELIARYPRLRSELLDQDGNLYSHVHVLINGRDAPYLDQGLQSELTSNDSIAIFPPVAGGAR